MAMGTRRQRQRQEELWYRRDLAEAPGHPFYRRLNEVLEQAGFDEVCETSCRKFYHEKLVMLIGFFEGIESERAFGGFRHLTRAHARTAMGANNRRSRCVSPEHRYGS